MSAGGGDHLQAEQAAQQRDLASVDPRLSLLAVQRDLAKPAALDRRLGLSVRLPRKRVLHRCMCSGACRHGMFRAGPECLLVACPFQRKCTADKVKLLALFSANVLQTNACRCCNLCEAADFCEGVVMRAQGAR